jgi:hypothetical protein
MDAGDCGGAASDAILLFKNGGWTSVKTHTLMACNQPPEPDLSDPF